MTPLFGNYSFFLIKLIREKCIDVKFLNFLSRGPLLAAQVNAFFPPLAMKKNPCAYCSGSYGMASFILYLFT